MKQDSSGIKAMARLGLTAKGITYCLLGILAFMAAFHIGGTSSGSVDKKGVFGFVEHQPGGRVLLGMLALGLLCYSVWRFTSAFRSPDSQSRQKEWSRKLRYVFSGLVYLSLAVYAGKMTLHQQTSGSGNQEMISGIFNQPFGQVLAGILAVVLAATGIYQCWYGLSGKYRKHVQKMDLPQQTAGTLLLSGKVGYIARGIVWLTLAWMLAKAAFRRNATDAGDTSQAFGYLQSAGYGPYLLGGVGLGLVCYGIFNFIRARYEGIR